MNRVIETPDVVQQIRQTRAVRLMNGTDAFAVRHIAHQGSIPALAEENAVREIKFVETRIINTARQVLSLITVRIVHISVPVLVLFVCKMGIFRGNGVIRLPADFVRLISGIVTVT